MFRLSLLGLVLLAQPLYAQVDITLIDVNQGDAILVTFPPLANGTRRHMLIDGGVQTGATPPVLEFLQDNNIDTLDWVVLTHPHNDHFNGLTRVLENLTVNELIWTGEARSGGTQWNAFDTAMDRAGSIVVATPGMTRSSQDARVEVLLAGGNHPNTNDGEDINNDSLSMMLYYEGIKVLFTGDIEGDGGNDLVDTYCRRSRNRCRKLDADIIKLPHHGSSHLSAQFVRFAAAEIGVVSAGFQNEAHHHPRTFALDTYQDFGMTELYSTSVNGDDNHVTITIDEDGDIVRPTTGNQTYSAWEDVQPDRECASMTTNDGFCLVLVTQGELP